jgi:phosphatidylserine/phosphatidylglycerophosphate/cardiolipin synthase-like enzyme
MTDELPDLAKRWATELPRGFARELSSALCAGPAAIDALAADTVQPASSNAVRHATLVAKQDRGSELGGLLRGRLDALEEQVALTPVWTGPESIAAHGRLTIAVVADLIAEARTQILLVSYATAPSDRIRQALAAAAEKGVAITLLLERPQDNPHFTGQKGPFPGLTARRLVWPAATRPSGASMHAKLLVIDRNVALVGSANLTSRALESNLECGVLIRGGLVPAQLAGQILASKDLLEL